jgi:hypothetical protein|tara:strand:- start:498 stop:770 length:273 start_codon:yes stop_codon:yes gene_type:complete
MSTNITQKYFSGATNGVIVTTTGFTRVMAVHAYCTVASVIKIADSTGDKITFEVPASGTADIYIGEMGIRFDATICCTSAGTGGITLFVG